MKYLRLLGLAAVAAAALIAVVGAGSASATVGCKTTTTPCNAKYEVGTEIHLQLKAGTIAEASNAWTTVRCKSTTGKGKVSNAGSAFATPFGNIETVVAGECTCSSGDAHVTWLKTGTVELHHIAGTDNATITAKGQQLTVKCTSLGVSCIFGSESSIDYGVITGGEKPTADGSATVPFVAGDSSQFVCGATMAWKADYEVTSPTPAYFEPS